MGGRKKRNVKPIFEKTNPKTDATLHQVILPDLKVSQTVKSTGVSSLAQIFGYQISDYNIPDLWTDTEGEGVLVAVLDTGVQLDHIDLLGSFVKHTNNVSDGHGHGTHCIGIISANNNDTGIVGIAPKASILAVKVLADNGSGNDLYTANGIYEAVERGADVISMSLGGPYNMPRVHQACKVAYKKGIPIIAAAGNSGNTGMIGYPGNYAETISIGALDVNKLRAGFSQTGLHLDFMAPGVNILSTVPKNNYAYMSGTSMATPWVAGLVALMIAKHRIHGGSTPLNGVEDIRKHLKRTAIDLGDFGRDNRTGWGLIDVKKAIEELGTKKVIIVPPSKPVVITPIEEPKPVAKPEPRQIPKPANQSPQPRQKKKMIIRFLKNQRKRNRKKM